MNNRIADYEDFLNSLPEGRVKTEAMKEWEEWKLEQTREITDSDESYQEAAEQLSQDLDAQRYESQREEDAGRWGGVGMLD